MLKKLRPYGRLVNWVLGACYDFYRFAQFGGWKTDLSSQEQRNFYAAKVYHSLEKSMSFLDNNPNSGWANANLLIDVIECAIVSNNIGNHDLHAYDVLRKFIDLNYERSNNSLAEVVKNRFSTLKVPLYIDLDNGVIHLTSKDIQKGKIANPYDFFYTRYSVREFSEERLRKDTIHDAIKLALKTPSACNRQPWHVYHLDDPTSIEKALSLQTGNRGFSHTIQDLLIICADLRAFNPGSERYQHWIDGGMFAMSIVYSLHSLGAGSCCLNWSHQGKTDKKLRKVIPSISNSHTIIMMLAVGNIRSKNQLCVSPRRSLDEIVTEI